MSDNDTALAQQDWLDKPMAQCIRCGQHPAVYGGYFVGAALLLCRQCNGPAPEPDPGYRCPGCSIFNQTSPCYLGCASGGN